MAKGSGGGGRTSALARATRYADVTRQTQYVYRFGKNSYFISATRRSPKPGERPIETIRPEGNW